MMEQTTQFKLGDNTNVGGYINKPLIPGAPFRLFLRAGLKSDGVRVIYINIMWCIYTIILEINVLVCIQF